MYVFELCYLYFLVLLLELLYLFYHLNRLFECGREDMNHFDMDEDEDKFELFRLMKVLDGRLLLLMFDLLLLICVTLF